MEDKETRLKSMEGLPAHRKSTRSAFFDHSGGSKYVFFGREPVRGVKLSLPQGRTGQEGLDISIFRAEPVRKV